MGGGSPVTLDLAEDCDFVAAGACKLPIAVAGKVTGRCRWRLPIRARGEGDDLRARGMGSLHRLALQHDCLSEVARRARGAAQDDPAPSVRKRLQKILPGR